MVTPSQTPSPRTDAPRTPVTPRQAPPAAARPPRKLDCSEAAARDTAEAQRPGERPTN